MRTCLPMTGLAGATGCVHPGLAWRWIFPLIAALACVLSAASADAQCTRPSSLEPSPDHCTPECPCEVGEGGCRDDADCTSGFCGQLQGARYGLPAHFGVCTAARCEPIHPSAPKQGPEICSEQCPCPEGWGHCDADEDCVDGLTCASDYGHLASLPDSYGICTSCPGFDQNFPVEGLCTEGCACGAGEGSCDENSDCQAGLVCKPGTGARAGLDASWGLCCEPFDASRTDWHFCDQCGCQEDEGDCDRDSDCAPGLYCGRDNGPRLGMPATLDLCTSRKVRLTVRISSEVDNVSVRLPNRTTCRGSYCPYDGKEGYEVAVTADVPSTGELSWSGCARVSDATCYVTLDRARTVRATVERKGWLPSLPISGFELNGF